MQLVAHTLLRVTCLTEVDVDAPGGVILYEAIDTMHISATLPDTFDASGYTGNVFVIQHHQTKRFVNCP